MPACTLLLLAAVTLVEVHGPDGQDYFVNTARITSLHVPTKIDLRRFASGTRCIIVTSAEKFLAVRETCAEVRKLIE